MKLLLSGLSYLLSTQLPDHNLPPVAEAITTCNERLFCVSKKATLQQLGLNLAEVVIKLERHTPLVVFFGILYTRSRTQPHLLWNRLF